LAIVAPYTWTLPGGSSASKRLIKVGGVAEKAKVKACGQLGVFVTAKFIKDGCVSIPTLIIRLLGDIEYDNYNT
jgi:hypothetical protein